MPGSLSVKAVFTFFLLSWRELDEKIDTTHTILINLYINIKCKYDKLVWKK